MASWFWYPCCLQFSAILLMLWGDLSRTGPGDGAGGQGILKPTPGARYG